MELKKLGHSQEERTENKEEFFREPDFLSNISIR